MHRNQRKNFAKNFCSREQESTDSLLCNKGHAQRDKAFFVWLSQEEGNISTVAFRSRSIFAGEERSKPLAFTWPRFIRAE
jgi:hypothetical protein